MKSKINFKCILHNGKKKTIKKTIEHPSFSEINSEDFFLKINEKYTKEFLTSIGVATITPIDSQIIDWLDNQYELKKDIMDSHDIMTILDYEVYNPKSKAITKQQQVFDVIAEISDNEQIMVDFMVTYHSMKKNIKDLSVKHQIMIVLNAMIVGYTASSVAYAKAIEMMKRIHFPNEKHLLKQ